MAPCVSAKEGWKEGGGWSIHNINEYENQIPLKTYNVSKLLHGIAAKTDLNSRELLRWSSVVRLLRTRVNVSLS